MFWCLMPYLLFCCFCRWAETQSCMLSTKRSPWSFGPTLWTPTSSCCCHWALQRWLWSQVCVHTGKRTFSQTKIVYSISSVTGGTLLERVTVRLSAAPVTAAWTSSAWSTATCRGRVKGWRRAPVQRSPNLTQESRVMGTVSSRAGSTAPGLR